MTSFAPVRTSSIRRTRMVLLLLPLMALAACDRSSTAAEHGEPASLELRERGGNNTLLAWTHGTGSSIHWDGGLPHLHPGDEIAINAIFRDADGNTIPLGGEFTVNAVLAQGSPTGVVALSAHGDHVDIDALSEGVVQIIFQLYHGNHSDWNAPPIELEVEDHD